MWFEWAMRKVVDHSETLVPGRHVDADMIEVADTAMDFRATSPASP